MDNIFDVQELIEIVENEKVVIDNCKVTDEFPIQIELQTGIYEDNNCKAFVKKKTGSLWYELEVRGQDLSAVMKMYIDLKTGELSPKHNFSTKQPKENAVLVEKE